ncbi:MAG: alpha/beta fold hydrolase [Phormidesmis sp.]
MTADSRDTAYTRTRNPVILVHGIWNSAAIFSTLKAYLEQEGWIVYALSMKPNNGDAPLEVLAEQVAAFAETVGQPFDLVGFSMGGLISRYYVQRLGGSGRVQRLVTVSAPHWGTALGLLSDRPGIQQMRPGSPFLQALNRDAFQLETLQFFSLWTPFDLLILPPWSSQLGVGKERRLSVPSHNRMICDSSGLVAIAQALSA